MAVLNCEGDPKLYTDGEYFDLSIIDGQPVMDQSLQNAVNLSLWGNKYWWGNVVSEVSEKISGNMSELSRTTLTNKTRQNTEEYAKKSLAWLVSDGVAKSVTVSATIQGPSFLGLNILIEQPDKTINIRYQINWETMEACVL
jgi:phage gp46-like protein